MIPTPVISLIALLPAASAFMEGLDPDTVARYGLLGLVLGWFMLKADKRLSGIESKMEGIQRTMLLDILSRPATSDRAKLECERELRRIAPELVD